MGVSWRGGSGDDAGCRCAVPRGALGGGGFARGTPTRRAGVSPCSVCRGDDARWLRALLPGVLGGGIGEAMTMVRCRSVAMLSVLCPGDAAPSFRVLLPGALAVVAAPCRSRGALAVAESRRARAIRGTGVPRCSACCGADAPRHRAVAHGALAVVESRKAMPMARCRMPPCAARRGARPRALAPARSLARGVGCHHADGAAPQGLMLCVPLPRSPWAKRPVRSRWWNRAWHARFAECLGADAPRRVR